MAKMHITVVQHGQFRGYIQSVSYARNKFNITADIRNAKGYSTEDAVQREIDKLTVMGFPYGYIFGYD